MMTINEIRALKPKPQEISVSEDEWFALAREIDALRFGQGGEFNKAWCDMAGTSELRLFGILVKRAA